MEFPWFVKLGTTLTPYIMKTGIPLVNGLIRKTIFKQFVGGETLEETAEVGNVLAKWCSSNSRLRGWRKESEESFDLATEEFIRVINYAATQTNIPFISIKVTGLARFDLLQTLNEAFKVKWGAWSWRRVAEWDRVRDRMYTICEIAAEKNVGVLIDAEESWIQDPIDRLCMEMMEVFNKDKVIVYNTISCIDTIAFCNWNSKTKNHRTKNINWKIWCYF